jgi:hypothetical protein
VIEKQWPRTLRALTGCAASLLRNSVVQTNDIVSPMSARSLRTSGNWSRMSASGLPMSASGSRTSASGDSSKRGALVLWVTGHEAKRAEFERRCAQIEREAARLDADRAELERLRASGLPHPDGALRAEIDRLTGEIERRSARLQADDAALEQERVRLDRREHGPRARAAKAPSWRDGVASEPERGESGAVEDALGAARRVAAQTRENARHLSSVLTQTANVLETSAALAEAHAGRLERAGRADAGAEQRRAADRAREAAHRARLQAKEWLDFALGRPH